MTDRQILYLIATIVIAHFIFAVVWLYLKMRKK